MCEFGRMSGSGELCAPTGHERTGTALVYINTRSSLNKVTLLPRHSAHLRQRTRRTFWYRKRPRYLIAKFFFRLVFNSMGWAQSNQRNLYNMYKITFCLWFSQDNQMKYVESQLWLQITSGLFACSTLYPAKVYQSGSGKTSTLFQLRAKTRHAMFFSLFSPPFRLDFRHDFKNL